MSNQHFKTWIAVILAVAMAVPAGAQAGEKKIVHLELKGTLQEAPPDPMALFASSKALNTKGLLDHLKKMRRDNDVEAVFITFERVGMGLAQIQELRHAIDQLKAADKEVYIHMDSCYSSGLYWLASSASHLAVVPTGDVWVTGLYGEQLYVKTLLGFMGIEADVIHIGDYKSAGEIVTRTEPSEAAAEMHNWLFDDLYRQMLEQIAESRSMKVARAEEIIDNGPYTAEGAKKAGLIDEVAYRKDFVDSIKARHGDIPFDKEYGESGMPEFDMSNPFTMFQELFGKIMQAPSVSSTPSIALIYVVGTITVGDGGGGGPFASMNHGASTPLRKALYEAAFDDNVKAVVLRVDSGGGSAVASEIIWHATKEVASRKPFIVSMGNVAGSGGYYVSCAADTIFAEPGTITGSIGVVGAKFVTKGFWDWAGVNWHPIQRGRNADIMATDEKWSDAHRTKIQTWMEDIYGVFKSRVQEKRGDKLAKPLEELAGGRVYTGAQALELGLVDKLGGLHDALKYASLEANLGEDYDVTILPKPKTIFDMLFENFGALANAQGHPALPNTALQAALPVLRSLEPLKAEALLRMLQQVELFQKEKVLTVMPVELVIR
ncbi:MAG: signal peptide peptidase SppA [Planctomycetes bacterium]|nr:signal peptide peptidase SppA [Planctomycetota bacterium]